MDESRVRFTYQPIAPGSWAVSDYGEFLCWTPDENAARIICLALEAWMAAKWMYGRFVSAMPKIHLNAN